jgi:hypothetical protein
MEALWFLCFAVNFLVLAVHALWINAWISGWMKQQQAINASTLRMLKMLNEAVSMFGEGGLK